MIKNNARIVPQIPFWDSHDRNGVKQGRENVNRPFSRRRIIVFKSSCLINRNKVIKLCDSSKMHGAGCDSSCIGDRAFNHVKVMALLLHVIVTMKSADAITFSPGDTYYSEEYFQRMLILERKRSRQSGKPFMLILLDIDKLLKGKQKEKDVVFQKLASILDSSTREIDVKGWYTQDSIIGIICQDVQKDGSDPITDKLSDSLIKGCYFSLNAKKTDAIKMLRLFYPDSQERPHFAFKPQTLVATMGPSKTDDVTDTAAK